LTEARRAAIVTGAGTGIGRAVALAATIVVDGGTTIVDPTAQPSR
jgi:NAD(P)-dependent dehydrogenase (short-subunit alcohol dehydrogenase family)